MAELTLNDPLSGDEIIAILLAEIEKRLKGDCTLVGGLAYAGFTAKFEIKLSFLRSLTKDTLVWGVMGTNVEGEPAGEATVAETYTSPSPNTARQSHNLPIPVIVQTPQGPVRRRVQIERAKS